MVAYVLKALCNPEKVMIFNLSAIRNTVLKNKFGFALTFVIWIAFNNCDYSVVSCLPPGQSCRL